MTEEVLVEGFKKPISAIYVKTAGGKIKFTSSNGFGRLLTSPVITDNGQTVGERNRAWLHAKLDMWLDGTFKEKNT